jgi:GDPmannose 4,6-dehydratase
MKVALITGITGQDGAYLAKHLLAEGYKVIGARRRSATGSTWRLSELGIEQDVDMQTFDLGEYAAIHRMIEKNNIDEFYNLAAQSFVATSFDVPLYTSDVDGIAITRILEAIRTVNPKIRFYQASTSEMYGKVQAVPQSETTPFYPRSPYAVAKLYAHWMTVNYRESYDMFACSGILFNHESPLRGLEFVTRKITSTLAMISKGQRDVLELGNLDALRDWGFAGDYVVGMYKMLQHDTPSDYVLATGVMHSVREFVEWSAQAIGVEIEWSGSAESEQGVDKKTGKVIVRVNPQFYRPAEVEQLQGSPVKAQTVLGWKTDVSAQQLCSMMVEADLRRLSEGKQLM